MSHGHDHGRAERRDERLLRGYLAARATGDREAMRDCWKALMTLQFDHLRAYAYLESRGRLNDQEREDAVQRAFRTLGEKRVLDFRGQTMGEWVTMAKLVVRNACIDQQRRERKHSRHRARYFADGDDDGADGTTAAVAQADAQAAADAAAIADDLAAQEDQLARGRAFLDWALPQLSEGQRELIEYDRAGVPVEEIMRRTGRRRDAVYKLRERAMTKLIELREEYGA